MPKFEKIVCFLSVLCIAIAVGVQAQAGFLELRGTCASFEKRQNDRQTAQLEQDSCLMTQGSGTGYYEQNFVWTSGKEFWIAAENYKDTDHLEFKTKGGPTFHSTEDLYGFNNCYITPKENGLYFHCFRANDD